MVGLDFHVGLLVVRAENVEFCHSAFLGEAVVTCEPAETSQGMVSQLHLVGPVTADATLARWLGEKAFPTRTR